MSVSASGLTIVSAVITGLFTIINTILSARLKNPSVPNISATATGNVHRAYGSIESLNEGKVLFHIGIIQFIYWIVTFAISSTMVSTELIESWILWTLALSIGFAWSGTQVRQAIRWKHLFYVAVGVSMLNVITSLIQLPPGKFSLILIIGIATVCIQTFVALGIGGVIASVISKKGGQLIDQLKTGISLRQAS